MGEKRKTLTYKKDDLDASVTVVRATAKIGIDRYLLASAGNAQNKDEKDEALRILRLSLFPDCICCSTDVTGLPWPMTFEQFVELPEEFVNGWVDAVYDINSHWRPPAEEVADKSKKSKDSPPG